MSVVDFRVSWGVRLVLNGYGLTVDNKSQWDLHKEPNHDIYPLIVVRLVRPDSTIRVFCLWLIGVEIGNKVWTL